MNQLDNLTTLVKIYTPIKLFIVKSGRYTLNISFNSRKEQIESSKSSFLTVGTIMNTAKNLLLAAALLSAPASATAVPMNSAPIPVTGQVESLPPSSAQAQPATSTPALVTLPSALPPQVTARLQARRNAAGTVVTRLTLQNVGPTNVTLTASRHSGQNCAYAPLLRVLKVGSRQVVYPTDEPPHLCTQEALNTTLKPQQSLTLEHNIKLPTGDYLLEGWFSGGINGQFQKISAAPILIKIK